MSQQEKKNQISCNQFLDTGRQQIQGKQRISMDDVSIALPPKQKSIKPKTEAEKLREQNYRLWNLNKGLKSELKEFESRLDFQLKKRQVSVQKSRHHVYSQAVESMELKNAYKQIEIYKREVLNLKKKQMLYQEQKVTDLSSQLIQAKHEKQQLLHEIKTLRKINKNQQKGLLGFSQNSYTKLTQQNFELKEQNKKLLQKKLKEERNIQFHKIIQQNQRKRQKSFSEKAAETEKKKESKEEEEKQILKKKLNRNEKQIKSLIQENKSLREIIQSLKHQISQKDKEMLILRNKLKAYRSSKKLGHSRRVTTQPTEEKSRSKTILLERQLVDEEIQKYEKSKQITEFNSLPSKIYPKIMQKGSKKQNSLKWNHQQFNSKIKEIQISLNPARHLQHIHFRYEKGAPPKSLYGNYSSFCCEQNGNEFIKKIRGGFQSGLLQYLIITTTRNRIEKFGKYELQNSCQNFTFGEEEYQYPGAFFGQQNEQGIWKIGCYIDVFKKQ